jgi:hypothetical protein
MKDGPLLFEAKSGKSRHTKLFACISEEEDGYMVEVRLFNETKPENSAWGCSTPPLKKSRCGRTRRLLFRSGEASLLQDLAPTDHFGLHERL